MHCLCISCFIQVTRHSWLQAHTAFLFSGHPTLPLNRLFSTGYHCTCQSVHVDKSFLRVRLDSLPRLPNLAWRGCCLTLVCLLLPSASFPLCYSAPLTSLALFPLLLLCYGRSIGLPPLQHPDPNPNTILSRRLYPVSFPRIPSSSMKLGSNPVLFANWLTNCDVFFVCFLLFWLLLNIVSHHVMYM